MTKWVPRAHDFAHPQEATVPLSSPASRVCLVAVPLAARSGVYRSASELVDAARLAGLDWSAVVGVREDSRLGPPPAGDPRRFCEAPVRGSHPRARYADARRLLQGHRWIRDADVVVTLVPFSDQVVSRLTRRDRRVWQPWVRGLPWPDAGETSPARRLVWRALETRALRQAREVWVTTPTLAAQVAPATASVVVPAGIAPVAPARRGGTVVWAGRYAVDKDPGLFVEAMRRSGAAALMHGTGALQEGLRRSAPPNVRVAGWQDPARLWDDAALFVGTSTREAFGRSAVEAAMAGLPVVLREGYGCADLLFTDPALRRRCVLASDRPQDWADAVDGLLRDRGAYEAAAAHVRANAAELTITASVRAADRRLGAALRRPEVSRP